MYREIKSDHTRKEFFYAFLLTPHPPAPPNHHHHHHHHFGSVITFSGERMWLLSLTRPIGAVSLSTNTSTNTYKTVVSSSVHLHSTATEREEREKRREREEVTESNNKRIFPIILIFQLRNLPHFTGHRLGFRPVNRINLLLRSGDRIGSDRIDRYSFVSFRSFLGPCGW